MGEVGAHNIFHGASITMVSRHGYVRVEPITYFTEVALLCLTCTIMDEVWINNIFHGTSFTVIDWHCDRRNRGPQHISRSQHYCSWQARLWVRSRPITYFTDPVLLCLAGTATGEFVLITYFTEPPLLCLLGTVMSVMARSGPITYFTKPAQLWLAGTVMGKDSAYDIFHVSSVTVFGWHDNGRDLRP